MELKIDEKVVETKMNEVVNEAVEQAVSGYEVGKLVREKIANEVVKGALLKGLEAAIDRLDIEAMTTALARELQRATVSAAVGLIRENAAQTVFKLRGHHDYDKDAAKKLQAIRQELPQVAAE